ncbi:MAG: SMC-Scp complex subunit ScpB [Oscillospiraceae bacterium]|nr:SMC-Scp complex subunit ScpB [Oscillospiraceae bacterium]MBP5169208.1 SMC-Scp complex subunit ScpB [Oscillospiraceae bacterium]
MTNYCSALEAILFAAGEPVPISRISLVLGIPDETVEEAARELENIFREANHAISVIRISDKLQLCSSPEYAPVITKILEQRKPPSLSPAALETLAVVAYYQPVTSAYISRIRGVDSSYTVASLMEKGLIEGKGRMEAPGRPTLYGTTDLFLRTMQISSLSDLPPLPEIASVEGIAKLQQAIDALQQQETQLQVQQITMSGL